MVTIEQIKNKIESETGLKVSIKINSINSSMRGYVTFSTKKQKGGYPEWSFEYGRSLVNEFSKPEPTPTFADRSSLHLYFGNEAYNFKTK